jgi:hypothetical protein
LFPVSLDRASFDLGFPNARKRFRTRNGQEPGFRNDREPDALAVYDNRQRGAPMRALVFVTATALVMSIQMVASAKAEATTVIKKDNDAGQTTVIKKQEEDRPFLAAPTTEKKVIIHKDRDDD